MVFGCSMCSFCATDNATVVLHVCKIHRDDPNFLVYCSRCLRSFRVWESYRKHVYRGCREDDDAASNWSTSQDGVQGNNDGDTDMDVSGYLETGNNDPKIDIPPMDWHAAKFILTIKERHILSQSAVDCILSSTTSLMSSVYQGILSDLKANQEVPESTVHLLESKFSCVESLFSELSTPYQQRRYFKEEFHKIEPLRMTFGTRYVWKRGTSKHRRRLGKVKDTFQYVPLLDSLKALLQHGEVRDEIEKGHCAPVGVLRDYCDGEFVKNHPLVKKNTETLLLAFYFDDLEIANPLGSRRGKHKLGMFYWMLLNIHPAHRSTLHSIQLLAVAKSNDIRLYGMDVVLAPVVDDLKSLAKDGISVTLDSGASRHYYGCLVTFLGDTPASALVGGFKEGVGGAYRCCSTCMIKTEYLDSVFDETLIRLRDIKQHKRHCALLDVPDASRDYGVNRLSILDEVPHFDLCKCLPHDIMHVLLEGVLPRHCKLLLVHCIFEEKYLSLKTANRLISEFEYGYSESKNIPRLLDSDHLRSPDSKLSQSASQMWLLGRLLTLIVGKYVPDSDAHWKCYVQLLRILTISTAVEVTNDTVSVLSLLVKDYLLSFNTLYPNSITPKLHYLIHLPRQMQLFGPLRHQWCMRFEGKNAYIKGLVGKNFKNIPYTIAERHQNYSCLRLLSPPGNSTVNLLYRGDEIGNVTYTPSDDATLPSNAREVMQSFPSTDTLPSAKTVTVLGKEFRPGAVVCVTPPSNLEYPTFGEICRILVPDHTKQLLVCLYNTEMYSAHFNAYHVVKTNQFSLISVCELGIHDVYHKYFVSPRMYVCIKSYHHIEYNI